MKDDTVIAGIVVTALSVGLIAYIGGFSVAENIYRQEAIDRGLAQYCPKDGSFAWKRECE